MGTLITAEGNDKNFYGLVCHSLNPGGWDEAPAAITGALDKIELPDDTEIGVVLMGGGMIGQMTGADLKENIRAIHRSKKKCVVYALEYSKEAIMKVIK